MDKTIRIDITGKVQGVYYRQSTLQKAITLGLQGEVWNNKDGSVSVVATGNEPALDELVIWCRQGPSRAVVHSVTVTETPYQSFTGFTIVR